MRVLLIALLAAVLPGCTMLDRAPVHIAQPVHGVEEVNNIYRDGRFFFSGQPDQNAIAELADRGVIKVINIRGEQEMAERVAFDEEAVCTDLHMTYVHLPLPREGRDEWLDQFEHELRVSRGPVLIHCGSSNRVGAVWGRYLRVKRGYTAEDALLRAQAAGVRSDSLIEWVTAPVPSVSH